MSFIFFGQTNTIVIVSLLPAPVLTRFNVHVLHVGIQRLKQEPRLA